VIQTKKMLAKIFQSRSAWTNLSTIDWRITHWSGSHVHRTI